LFDQQQPSGGYVILLRLAETVVPFRELVSVLDVPSHRRQYIPLMEYIQEAKFMGWTSSARRARLE
jgi:hypothetical protein